MGNSVHEGFVYWGQHVSVSIIMINKSGQLGVPVIIVDGELTVGFDQAKLEKMLGL